MTKRNGDHDLLIRIDANFTTFQKEFADYRGEIRQCIDDQRNISKEHGRRIGKLEEYKTKLVAVGGAISTGVVILWEVGKSIFVHK
jgi:hypothetical protein